MARLEVTLPWCPRCDRVGKIPGDTTVSRGQFYCVGPLEAGHSKTRMKKKRFRGMRA